MANPQEPVRLGLRKLWTDHVIYTREYVRAAIQETGDAQNVAARLLRNQEDIGDAIKPYYGDGAGNKLTDLLKTHIMIAVDLVEAAKKGDNDRFGHEDAKWKSNAQDIARFLASANPNWPEKDVFDLLSLHLKLTTDEAVAVLQKDYDKAIKLYDDIVNEILVLSDALYDGLVAQFPERFRTEMAKAA
jgi:hypothetical protein